MNKIKIFFLVIILNFFSTNVFSEEKKKDCSKITNLYKKMTCKLNNATSSITSKKTVTDWIKKKE